MPCYENSEALDKIKKSFFFVTSFMTHFCHLMKEEIETKAFLNTLCGSRNEPRCRATPHQTGRGVVRFATTSLPWGFIV